MSIFNYFKHITLSPDQESALSKLEAFLASPAQVFILKGYAGSGKTTILKGFVEYLDSIEKDFILMAPTGRAAKVIRERTGQDASTIHRYIYSFEETVEIKEGDSFYYYFKIRNNDDVIGNIFIVDEASMISDAKNEGEFFRFGSSHLLTDLISFTRVANLGAKTKIVFVGDPCQLPPVGDSSSKAFEASYLSEKFNLDSQETEMKEVKRQSSESGISEAASKLRKSITAGYFNDFNLRSNGIDMFNPTYENFLDTWMAASSPKIIIASKNKTCVDLNLQIRKRIFGESNIPIQKGDIVILGGNNYGKGVFNGEFAIVNNVSENITHRIIPLRGQHPVSLYWRDIELVFPDNEIQNKIVKGKMLENFLSGDNNLRPEETRALYVDFINRHDELDPESAEFNVAIRQDEFFNCLLLKYGYAVTGHKAQGGEWDNVFTVWDNDNREDFNCFTDKQRSLGKVNLYFFRWAYTAITRASKKLYAINPPFFNSYSNLAFLDDKVLSALENLTGVQVQAEEISLDSELDQHLAKFNLLDEPIPLQNHFIKVCLTARKQHIELIGWEKLGYEIRYTFERAQNKAVLRTSINGKNEFINPFQVMPKLSPNKEFNEILSGLLANLPIVSIKRNADETVYSQIKFDTQLEEELPFLFSLYDELVKLLKDSGVVIGGIEHMQYRERYTFKLNDELAVIDFEYNKNGFFGRVIPVPNLTKGNTLLSIIKATLKTIKQD